MTYRILPRSTLVKMRFQSTVIMFSFQFKKISAPPLSIEERHNIINQIKILILKYRRPSSYLYWRTKWRHHLKFFLNFNSSSKYNSSLKITVLRIFLIFTYYCFILEFHAITLDSYKKKMYSSMPFCKL